MMPMMSWLSYTTWLVLAALLVVVALVAIAVAVSRQNPLQPGPGERLRAPKGARR
jgi:hypothetical protein